ncbi:hypothetical protein TNCV_4396391 [Trichonephila clavipes]|uniref:Uncharacterized protein n=1 Tax=Trichonephila clavipes TaxID=2585209 RepID=A0A8X7BDY8_TRICX|nr:hypothetical protein TNCV_4396391 [Trichonephila clavipes]
MSCVIGMISVWLAEICPASDVCPVCWRQNSDLRRGMSSVSVEELCPATGVLPLSLEAELCPEVCPVAWRKTRSCVIDMISVQEAELCPASGVCPVGWRQNSVLHQELKGGRIMFNVRGMAVDFAVRTLTCVRRVSSFQVE